MRRRPVTRFQPSWLSAVAQTPGVVETLQWLVTRGEPGLPLLVMRPSRLNALVRVEDGRWKADGAAFERTLLRSIGRLPREPGFLAKLLCGFGEMAARCHYDPMAVLEAKLRQLRLTDREWTELIGAAVGLSWKEKRPPTVRQISIAQAVAKSDLDWELLEFARSWVQNEPEMSRGGHYGLVFVLCIVLRLKPKVLHRWHQRCSGKPVTSVMMSMVGAELWHGRDALPDRLLATRIPFCIAIAIAIYADATDHDPQPVSYRALAKKLTGQGASTADAIWLTAHILKDAVRRHHVIASQGKGLVAQARRDQKTRASTNRQGEPNWISARRADHAKRKSDHEHRLEELLADIAAVWPIDGLSERQMEIFDTAFIDIPDMRLRLAQKLVHRDNRESLLKRNINQFKSEVGLSGEPIAAFDEYHAPEPERFYDLSVATARSFIALHREAPDDIGRRTSNLLARGVKAGFEFLEQPFMRARQPMRWQSALSRTSCAVIFALVVVATVEQAHQPAVEKLRQLTLEHAANLLAVSQNFSGRRSVLDTLAGLSIHAMMDRPTERDELIAWSQRADLPPIVRARALFAIAQWLPPDHEQARELFHGAAQLPLSARAEPEQLNRLATLVDFAIARASPMKDAGRLALIVELWSAIKSDWGRHMADCEEFAHVLVRALTEDGPERRRILDDDMFSGSYVRSVIDAAWQRS